MDKNPGDASVFKHIRRLVDEERRRLPAIQTELDRCCASSARVRDASIVKNYSG
jgi:hypothetical protein